MVTVSHLESIPELFAHRAYAASTCLVVDTTLVLKMLAHEPARGPIRSLLGLLAGWERALLLVAPEDSSSLAFVWNSPVAARCTVLDRESLSARGMQLAIVYSRSQAARLPPIVTDTSAVPEGPLAMLRGEARSILRCALAEPQLWDVKRLADALGMTRRSLERLFRRVGLPTPAALLGKQHKSPSR